MTDLAIHPTAIPTLPVADLLADPAIRVVAWPGRRLAGEILPGDVIRQQALGVHRRSFIVTTPPPPGGRVAVEVLDLEAMAEGRSGAATLALCGPDRMLRGDLTVLRPLPPDETGEIVHEASPPQRPTIRQGSRGPAVIDAQQRLNRVHAAQVAARQAGLARSPLQVDGIFGGNTRAATVSFQRLAFPGLPREWDGIIGLRSWTALVARSDRPGPVIPVPPVAPPIVPPIVPGDFQLRPSRWDAILRPLASGRTNLRSGNAVRALIDGNETFDAMAADMGGTGPGDFIYLLGWDNFDTFALGSASQFRDIYTAAATREVEVAAMLWDQPVLGMSATGRPIRNPADLSATEVVSRINALADGKAIMDDITAGNSDESRVRLAIAGALAGINRRLIPVILRLIEPDIARLTGSHHQKVLVVKQGARLIGYCGGIDMNPNRLSVVDPDAGQPHHDTHCRIEGPSAFDLLATFLSRWKHHPASRGMGTLRGTAARVPGALASPGATVAPFGGPVSVMIARTFNPVHVAAPDVVRERGIQSALLAAIAAARRFIYCEDQYLIDIETARALRAALPNLSHVTILIPGNGITDMPSAREYRRNFVDTVITGLPRSERAKFRVYQLSTSQSSPVFGDHTYVHSKSWVFDDELAVIGTANCNRRSYTYDSEVGAFIFEEPRREGDTRRTFAQSYRMALWQHHLAATSRQVENGATSVSLWRSPGRSSSAKVLEFDHTLPTGFTSRAGLRQQVMNRKADLLQNVIDPVL